MICLLGTPRSATAPSKVNLTRCEFRASKIEITGSSSTITPPMSSSSNPICSLFLSFFLSPVNRPDIRRKNPGLLLVDDDAVCTFCSESPTFLPVRSDDLVAFRPLEDASFSFPFLLDSSPLEFRRLLFLLPPDGCSNVGVSAKLTFVLG